MPDEPILDYGTGRQYEIVPHGANYCTAHGYDCECEQGVHDTHTRVTPHERRNGTLSADGTVALIASFIAIDALSTLDAFTFAEPDWVGGECPGLCDPLGIDDLAGSEKWNPQNYEYSTFAFSASTGCPEGTVETYVTQYEFYVLAMTIVAVAGLITAVQNATLLASGSYLLYDAAEGGTKKTGAFGGVYEKGLIDRFDLWWASTGICRFLMSRVAFIVCCFFYIVAIWAHPKHICASDEFTSASDMVKAISTAGFAALAINWVFMRVMEKFAIMVQKATDRTGTDGNNWCNSCFRILCTGFTYYLCQWKCIPCKNGCTTGCRSCVGCTCENFFHNSSWECCGYDNAEKGITCCGACCSGGNYVNGEWVTNEMAIKRAQKKMEEQDQAADDDDEEEDFVLQEDTSIHVDD